MKRFLVVFGWLAALAVSSLETDTADAADRYYRSGSQYRSRSNYSGSYGSGFNSYSSRFDRPCYSQPSMIVSPETNTLYIGRDAGYGSTYYQATPLWQYGASGINYQTDRYGNVDPYASGIIQRPRFGW